MEDSGRFLHVILSCLCGRPAFRSQALAGVLWLLPGLWTLPSANAATATTITATPASLTFQYQLGTVKLPVAQSISLKSSDTNIVLTVTVSGDLNGDWLAPSVRPGSTITLPASITANVTPTSLAAGSYSATITLSGMDAQSNPVTQAVPVILEVLPAPSELDFSPPAGLIFNYVTGNAAPPNQQFWMYSEGAPMTVTLSIAGASWLKLNPSGSVQVGGLYMPITLSIDPTVLATLAPKAYAASITVSAPTAINKSTTYPVTLNVNAAKPVVTDTWPSGIVLSASGSGSTVIVLDGANFFSTSTVAATGFTSSTVVTVTDSAGPPDTATETFSIPVYPAGASFLRVTLASPLPTGFVGTSYSQNLAVNGVAGGTGPYSWSAVGLGGSGLALSALGVLSGATPVAGVYQPVITVTDAAGLSAYMPLTLTVYGAAAPPAGTLWITIPNVLFSAVAGIPYTATLDVTNTGTAPYQWSHDSAMPAGLDTGAAGTTVNIAGSTTAVGLTGNLTQKLLSNGALQVTIPNTFLTARGFVRMAVTTPPPGGGSSNEAQLQVYGPEPRVLGVANAASYANGTVAPGELISIFGTGLGPAILAPYDPTQPTLLTALPFPAPPAGVTQVWFSDGSNAWPSALIFTSATQVGAMVPYEVANATSLSVLVSYAGVFSQAYPLSVLPAVPGIFTADASGQGQGAILNYIASSGDYTVNSASNPAILKNAPIVVLYVTGFGATAPASADDLPAGAGVDTAIPASVSINGIAAAPVVTGVPQGSFPGLLQLNVTVPANAPAGKTVPVTVSFNGANAQTGVTLALK